MVLAIDVVAHVTELDIVLGSLILRWQVADVVGLAEVVPCQDLDDVRLDLVVARDGFETLREEGIAVGYPGVERVAVVEVLVLPWGHGCR